MTVLLSLVILFVGALAYFLSANPKVVQMGFWTYCIGLAAFLLQSNMLSVLVR